MRGSAGNARRSGWLWSLGLGLALLFTGVATPVAWSQPGAGGELAALKAEGNELVRARKFAEAEGVFRQALALAPDDFDAAFTLGRVLERLERFADAHEIYQGLTVSAPERSEPIYRLALVHRSLGRYAESVAAYEKYMAREPSDPDPWYGLAKTYETWGKAAEAIATYERYIAVETRPTEARYVALAQEAVVTLRAQLEAAPPPPAAEVAPLETAPVALGAEAAPPVPPPLPESAPARTLAVLSPLVEGDLEAQGDAAFAAGDYPTALARYTAALQEAPRRAHLAYKRGVALVALEDLPGAIDAWELALNLAPDFRLARDQMERAKQRIAVGIAPDPVDVALAAEALAAPDDLLALATTYAAQARHHGAARLAGVVVARAPSQGSYALLIRLLARIGAFDSALNLVTAMAAEPAWAVEALRLRGEVHAARLECALASYYFGLYVETVDPEGRDAELNGVRRGCDEPSLSLWHVPE